MEKRITLRIPAAISTAAKRAGKSLTSSYFQQLAAADLGVEVGERKPGLGSASEKTRKKVAKSGASARWKES